MGTMLALGYFSRRARMVPNHIAGKGTIRALREKYPKANIVPIDYDPGATRVNQENRLKLMLAVAREEEQQ